VTGVLNVVVASPASRHMIREETTFPDITPGPCYGYYTGSPPKLRKFKLRRGYPTMSSQNQAQNTFFLVDYLHYIQYQWTSNNNSSAQFIPQAPMCLKASYKLARSRSPCDSVPKPLHRVTDSGRGANESPSIIKLYNKYLDKCINFKC
jgi:hypothetical protein